MFNLLSHASMLVVVTASICFVCFVISSYYVTYYFGFVASGVSAVGSKPPASKFGKSSLPVSVIICVHNDIHILETVKEVLAQDYSNFEVLVVADRCTEILISELTTVATLHPTVTLVPITTTPTGFNAKKYAITRGIQKANYPHLIFTDADCIPSSKYWLQYMADGFSEAKQIVIGVGQYKADYTLLNALVQFETLFTALQYIGIGRGGKPYMGVGRNMGYIKAIFNETKGFEGIKNVSGGDDDLLLAKLATFANTTFILNPDAATLSNAPKTFRAWLAQKHRHFSVGRYYPNAIKLRLGLLAMSYTGLYISILALMFTSFWLLGMIIWMLRLAIVWVVYSKAANALKMPLGGWKILLLDVAYAYIYFGLGVYATLNQRKKW